MTVKSASDLVIEMLADSEAKLRERVVSLEAALQSYAELAREAIHHLHKQGVEVDRLTASNHRLHNALRASRRELDPVKNQTGRAA